MRCVIDDFNNVRRASERIRVVEANVGSGEPYPPPNSKDYSSVISHKPCAGSNGWTM